MKILSYYQLKEMPQTVPARKEVPYFINQLDWPAWKHELIAVLGPRASCQLIFNKIFRETGLASTDVAAGYLFEEFLYEAYSHAILAASETLYQNIYSAIEKEQPAWSKIRKGLITQQYLEAAYLPAYSYCTYQDLNKTLQKQAMLAVLFASAGQILLLPDVFKQSDFAEKAVLQRVIQNLRQIPETKKTIFFQTQQPEEAIYLADRIVVAAGEKANPIGDVIPVGFNQVRNRWIIKELPAFKILQKRLTQLLTDNFAPQDTFSFIPSQLIS